MVTRTNGGSLSKSRLSSPQMNLSTEISQRGAESDGLLARPRPRQRWMELVIRPIPNLFGLEKKNGFDDSDDDLDDEMALFH